MDASPLRCARFMAVDSCGVSGVRGAERSELEQSLGLALCASGGYSDSGNYSTTVRASPFRDMDQSEKHRQRTDSTRVRLLRAGLPRLFTLDFDGRRRALHADDARRTCRLCRKRTRAPRIAFAHESAVSESTGFADASAASARRDVGEGQSASAFPYRVGGTFMFKRKQAPCTGPPSA